MDDMEYDYEDLELYAYDEEMNSTPDLRNSALHRTGNGCLSALFIIVITIVITLGGQS